MKTAYIFHDAFCDQFSDWYPWMKSSLEAQGYLVVLPRFPTPAGQSYASWKAVIKNYLDKLDGDTMIIGHGTGGVFALQLLNELSVSINSLFLVASYAKPIGHVGYDRVNETFLAQPFAWDKIKSSVRLIQVFAGENDPFVPKETSEDLAKNLGQGLHIIPSGEHLNKASGFTQIIPLLQSIRESAGKLDKTIEVETILQASDVPPLSLSQSPKTAPLVKGSTVTEPVVIKEAPKSITGVHTMYQDMSQLVNSNQGAVASSLLTKARTDVAVKKAEAPLSSRNIPYIIGTLIALFLIIGIGTFILNQKLPTTQKSSAVITRSLILAERHVKIDLAGESYVGIKKVRDALIENKGEGIADFYYVNGGLRTSFPVTLSKLGVTTLPETLTNEFLLPQSGSTPLFMHGGGSIEGAPIHFLVLPVAHYDVAFAGMKDWEPTMVRDVGIFMNIPEETLKTRSTRDTFVDQVVNNRNIRIMKDPETGLTLAYFFLTERTIVIIDEVAGIPEVLKRFANSQIYR